MLMRASTTTATDRRLESFDIFNRLGGKFRVAVINACNLDCYFCHNEAMANPRRLGAAAGKAVVDDASLVRLINAFCALGGRQVNITGGEPLAHPDLVPMLRAIDKRGTRVVLNTNALLADRLLAHPRVENLDDIFASLHTTDEELFRDTELGGRERGSVGAGKVMDSIVALKRAGYGVQINFSLGPRNLDSFDAVLDFSLRHDIALKAIALVRSSDDEGFYGGEWIEPRTVAARIEARGARLVSVEERFGGHTTTYLVGDTKVQVKNVARGRLETDFCRGCLHKSGCGEGIYGLRVGTDGLVKPCLLRRDRFRPLLTDGDYREQILDTIDEMIGDWKNARFRSGAPA